MAGYGYNTGLDGHRVTPLTEEEVEEIAEGLSTIYDQARERMLTTVSNRLASGRIGYGWAEKKAGEVNAAHAQLERDMDRAREQRAALMNGLADRAAVTGSQRFYSDMQAMLGDVAHISPNSAKAAYILADLNNTLDFAERRILRQFDDKYADVIGAVSSELATGVMTARQAVGEALIHFADQGITGFVDRAGHHWTLENYAEMAALTAIERATLSSYVDTMQSYGFDLAVVDGHGGSCPICRAWEGVIVSVSGNDPNYPSLTEAEDEGVFHPRCIHGITTYYPGISHEPKGSFRNEPREVQPPTQAYTARSRQRYMERQIRKYKDRLIVAQTAQQKMMARNKIREWRNALNELIDQQPDDNYMYRHSDRETANKSLTGTGKSGTINMSTGYYRRRPHHNTGAFATLKEPVTLEHAKLIMRQMGILKKGITYQVDAQENLVGTGFFGYTSPDGKTVTFYPDAFTDRAHLVKTCGHESIHVKQVEERGVATDSQELIRRENEAVDSEEAFWKDYQKRMK